MSSSRLLGLFLIATLVPLLSCTTVSYWDAPETYSGSRLYETFCVSCHGPWGEGDGRVAPYLSVPVPDLTLLAARNGGIFPEEEVYRIIDGRSEQRAHGTRHMPVWGYRFETDDSSDEAARRDADRAIKRLVDYLASLQKRR